MLKHSNKKIINATKWSTAAEVSSRLVAPLTSMILARILTPEAFGIVASITLIITFFDLFVESGFHNYLIQNKFENDQELNDTANVAFWTNILLSSLFFTLIFIYSGEIVGLLKVNGLEFLLIIASFQLFTNAFISVPSALLKRELNFKSLFFIKIVSVFIPLIITIPLAIIGFSYWSVVIGNISMSLCTAIIINLKTSWNPKFSFCFSSLKKMYSFSFWTQTESIVIWLTVWIDTLIIAMFLDSYHLGIFKTSTSLVNNVMAIIASSMLPVLFASLSRLQDSPLEFNNVLFKFQKVVALIVAPLGVGLYIFSDLATQVLLGNQWSDASGVIGLWGLSSAIVISLGYFNSEVYRAKGKPKLSVLSQLIHLSILVPSLLIFGKQSFEVLVYIRVIVRILGTFIGVGFLHYFFNIKANRILSNIAPAFLAAVTTGLLGYVLTLTNPDILMSIMFAIICIVFYMWMISKNDNTKLEFHYFKNLVIKMTISKIR